MSSRQIIYRGGVLRRGKGGNHRTIDGFIDYEGPIQKEILDLHQPMPVSRPGVRRGEDGYDKREVEIYAIRFVWATRTEQTFMNIIEELKGNYDQAAALWESYEKKLQEFRSMVKNDIASLEAGARKTTEAVHKMKTAYGDVIQEMTSPKMEQAILNAERLAAAMTALAGLKPQEMSFNVVAPGK
jgi:hypothetical protein